MSQIPQNFFYNIINCLQQLLFSTLIIITIIKNGAPTINNNCTTS